MDEARRDQHWGIKDLDLYRVAHRAAVVCGIFSAVLAVLLVASHVQERRTAPLESAALKALAEQYKNEPKNEALQASIRDLDLLARKAYFGNLAFMDLAALALLVGIILTLAGLRLAEGLRPEPPRVSTGEGEDPAAARSTLRWALAGVGVVIVFFALVFPRMAMTSPAGKLAISAATPGATSGKATAEKSEKTVPKATVPGGAGPSREEVMRNWPNLRGPFGHGVAFQAAPPTQWDGASGKNVKWKAEIPKPGFNSPVIWGDRVFVTGADAGARVVCCYGIGDGRLLWQKSVASSSPTPKVSEDTGFAASTAAVDGRRVFAIFATGDLAAFDFDGKELWTRHFEVGDIHYGYASSLIAWKHLFVQADVNNAAALHALDPETGKTVWTKARKADPSWASPILVCDGNREWVVCAAAPALIAYEVSTGNEALSVPCLAGEVAPSASYAAGMLFAAMEYSSLTAIALSTKQKAWSSEDDLPNAASPVATASTLFMVNANGVANAFESSSGKKLWNHEFQGEFYPSPIVAGDMVFFSDNKGVTHIAKADKSFALVGESALGEASGATPAFQGKRMLLRGKTRLYCISAE